MKQKILILCGLVVLIIVGVFVALSFTKEQVIPNTPDQEVAMGEPVDVALDFYYLWLDTKKSTSTDPYQSGLADEQILSMKLRARLAATQTQAEIEVDPVLCQITPPEGARGQVVSQSEDAARILIRARNKELTGQAIFSLIHHNDGWFISDIECAPGEFAPPREFTFEKEGFLLKNVPPPLDPNKWHIVFEENGEPGHTVPLFFNEKSVCSSFDGTESVCDPTQFTEPVKVSVFGQMTELGVDVVRLEFSE